MNDDLPQSLPEPIHVVVWLHDKVTNEPVMVSMPRKTYEKLLALGRAHE